MARSQIKDHLRDGSTSVVTFGYFPMEQMMGQEIRGEIYVDRGYKGHDYQGPAQVKIAKPKRRQEPELRRWYRKRNGIEAAISHMKNDGWLGRNHLKGAMGNRVNALLAACGQNLRKLLRWLAEQPATAFCAFLRLLVRAVLGIPPRPAFV